MRHFKHVFDGDALAYKTHVPLSALIHVSTHLRHQEGYDWPDQHVFAKQWRLSRRKPVGYPDDVLPIDLQHQIELHITRCKKSGLEANEWESLVLLDQFSVKYIIVNQWGQWRVHKSGQKGEASFDLMCEEFRDDDVWNNVKLLPKA